MVDELELPDFDRGWSVEPDTVPNPELSLGIIVWHPASAVDRALPSTATQADKDTNHPVRTKLGGTEESISRYFKENNAFEAFLSVRQTDLWNEVKDDPVYATFDHKSELIPIDTVRASFRRARQGQDKTGEEAEGEVKLADKQDCAAAKSLDKTFSSDYSTGDKPTPRRSPKVEETSTRRLSSIPLQRKNSVHTPSRVTDPAPVGHQQDSSKSYDIARDDAQEDVLAKLGVTGSPKTVRPTTGPGYKGPSGSENTRLERSPQIRERYALISRLNTKMKVTRYLAIHHNPSKVHTRLTQNIGQGSERPALLIITDSTTISHDNDRTPRQIPGATATTIVTRIAQQSQLVVITQWPALISILMRLIPLMALTA